MIYRKHTLFDQGLSCIILLVLGISNATPFISPSQRRTLDPFLIPVLLLVLLVSWYHETKHDKENIRREQRDERNQMILEKSVWYCHQAESGILLVLYAILILFLDEYETASILLWVLIGRNLLAFVIRWWLNREY